MLFQPLIIVGCSVCCSGISAPNTGNFTSDDRRLLFFVWSCLVSYVAKKTHFALSLVLIHHVEESFKTEPEWVHF